VQRCVAALVLGDARSWKRQEANKGDLLQVEEAKR